MASSSLVGDLEAALQGARDVADDLTEFGGHAL
jgi:hypothetical protein